MAYVRHVHQYSRDLMSVHVADASKLDWDPFAPPAPPKPLTVKQVRQNWTGPREKAKPIPQESEDKRGE